MNCNEREDIYESNRLAESVDIANLSYESTMLLSIYFCSEILLSDKIAHKVGVSPCILVMCKYLVNQAMEFFEQKIPVTELRKCRVLAWELFDRKEIGTSERNLIRVVTCILYEKDFEEFDEKSDDIIDNFLSVLLDLGSGYCSLFSSYVMTNINKFT
jgi:hypothetical protein